MPSLTHPLDQRTNFLLMIVAFGTMLSTRAVASLDEEKSYGSRAFAYSVYQQSPINGFIPIFDVTTDRTLLPTLANYTAATTSSTTYSMTTAESRIGRDYVTYSVGSTAERQPAHLARYQGLGLTNSQNRRYTVNGYPASGTGYIARTITYPQLTTTAKGLLPVRVTKVPSRLLVSSPVASTYRQQFGVVPNAGGVIRNVKDYPSEEDYIEISEEMENDFANVHRTIAEGPTRYYHHRGYRSPTGQSGYGVTSDGHMYGLGKYYSPMMVGSQQAVPIIAEIHTNSGPKFDLKTLAVIALLKIGLAKLKFYTVMKIIFLMLLKLKLFLIAIFVKFVLFLKALKLLKALLIPYILLSLAPLFSLLLLPLLLLPLLLALPIPSIQSLIDSASGGSSNKNSLKVQNKTNQDPVMEVLRQLLESEECIERIACQLATKREAKIMSPIINWFMRKLQKLSKNNARLLAYAKAYLDSNREYNESNEELGAQWCFRRYACPANNSSVAS